MSETPGTHRFTKAEAIEKMKEGIKMRHCHFSDDEWAIMENGKMVLEDGVRCSPHEFWHWRIDDSWNTGWGLYEEWSR